MKNNLIKDFKDKIQSRPVFGPFAKTSDPAFIECLGYANFDFVILDMEHSPNTILNMQNLIRAAEISGILPIVRVKENCPSLIGEVLDIGVKGIQVPQITCSNDVRQLVKLAKFAPIGMRGVCRYVRAANYGSLDQKEYYKDANDCLTIIQLEGQVAINNLDEILEESGYDILFIGPYDLSQALGVPGEINHTVVEEKIKRIVLECKKKDIVVGIFADNEEDVQKWIKLGVKYISYSVDVGFFYSSYKAVLKRFKNIK